MSGESKKEGGQQINLQGKQKGGQQPWAHSCFHQTRPPAGEEVALTGRVRPKQQGTAATRHRQLQPREGQEQKATKRKGRESWMAAVSPPRPSQPWVVARRCPDPSTTLEDGTGRPEGRRAASLGGWCQPAEHQPGSPSRGARC